MGWEYFMRAKSLLIALFMLAGCSVGGNSLQELKAKKPGVDSFGEALAAEYLAYADSLSEEGHPIRAKKFADKGLLALEKGDAPLEQKEELAKQREALMAVLTPDVKEITPQRAARAQLLFDCWADKEGVCKKSFAEALADLQPVADALVHGENNRFVAQFARGSDAVNADVAAILDIVAHRVSGYGAYQINLAPPLKKSLLNTKRLLALEKGLIARGVNAGHIEVEGKSPGKEVRLSSDRKAKSSDSIVITLQTSAVVP